MKNWNAFHRAVDTFLRNIEFVDHTKVVPMRMDLEIDEVVRRLKGLVKDLIERPYYEMDENLYHFIAGAKNELSEYLIDTNKREGTIKKISKEFELIDKRFRAVTKKWDLNNTKKHGMTLYHGYFDTFQPVYEFHKWFLVEAELYKWEGKQLIPVELEVEPENEEMNKKKMKIRQAVGAITLDNVREVYQKNFNQFLYMNSDNVEINGEIVNSKMQRALMLLPNEQGEPNVKTAFADGIREGFPITELDFIEHECSYVLEEDVDEFKLKKQVRLYLEYINKRVQQQQNEVQTSFDYPPLSATDFISKTEFDYFKYLCENLNVRGKKRWTYIYNELKESKVGTCFFSVHWQTL